MNALKNLIEKYEKDKQSQVEMKKYTHLSYATQHQLLDQNIHIFDVLLNELRSLEYANGTICEISSGSADSHEIATDFADTSLKVVCGLLSDDYKTGYVEGITHFIENKKCLRIKRK